MPQPHSCCSTSARDQGAVPASAQAQGGQARMQVQPQRLLALRACGLRASQATCRSQQVCTHATAPCAHLLCVARGQARVLAARRPRSLRQRRRAGGEGGHARGRGGAGGLRRLQPRLRARQVVLQRERGQQRALPRLQRAQGAGGGGQQVGDGRQLRGRLGGCLRARARHLRHAHRGARLQRGLGAAPVPLLVRGQPLQRARHVGGGGSRTAHSRRQRATLGRQATQQPPHLLQPRRLVAQLALQRAGRHRLGHALQCRQPLARHAQHVATVGRGACSLAGGGCGRTPPHQLLEQAAQRLGGAGGRRLQARPCGARAHVHVSRSQPHLDHLAAGGLRVARQAVEVALQGGTARLQEVGPCAPGAQRVALGARGQHTARQRGGQRVRQRHHVLEPPHHAALV
mmetsp:Transcript_19335/g.49191  ORF Transcript_19335/g.49191 Transcript_19335/m.49191 type:complete len:402 (-) Transcript_19335:487-1692(-)